MSNNLRLSIDILESDTVIAKKILGILAKKLNKKLVKSFDQLQDQIKSIIINSLKNQPEYSSLLGGQLQYEFGIPDPSSRLNSIINTLEQSMIARLNKVIVSGYQLKGGFSIEFIKSDYNDILSLPDASFVTEKGSKLEWLNWLLLQGDSSIVIGYSFILGGFKFSRTGGGVMRSNNSGFWRVPPQFAGTQDNNWIIRGILAAESDINNLLGSFIENLPT